MSIKAGSIIFYSVQVSLIHFSAESRKPHIVDDKTITAYLPVSLSAWEDNGKGHFASIATEFTSTSVLRALHERMETALQCIADQAKIGVSCETLKGFQFLFHINPASYRTFHRY